jgi:methylthioribose-1-phosphate isomerase
MSTALQSLRYTRGSLEVLDQLLLPTESTYVPILNCEDAWSVIRTMQVRGVQRIRPQRE